MNIQNTQQILATATVLETISGMSRNSPKSYGMRRSKIWTTKFHAPLDFCLSFSLLLVYSIFVPFLAGHLLSFSYIFACLIFIYINYPDVQVVIIPQIQLHRRLFSLRHSSKGLMDDLYQVIGKI